MNNDQNLIAEAYSRIYLKVDEDFNDQVLPSPLERAEGVYGDDTSEASDEVALERAIEDSIKQEEADFGEKYTTMGEPEYYTDPEGNKIAIWMLYDKTADGGNFSSYTFNFTTKKLTNFVSSTQKGKYERTLTPLKGKN